jgi:peptidylprolyl isomerase
LRVATGGTDLLRHGTSPRRPTHRSSDAFAGAAPAAAGTVRRERGDDRRLTEGAGVPERPQIAKPEGDIPFELGIEDLVVGEGDEAVAGRKVSVHYVGVAFSTGDEFDASWNRGQPFSFKLGRGQVIKGWDDGVQGMRVGGRRRLTIPSAMAYGARGAGNVIRPHEPLVFVVDLLAVD